MASLDIKFCNELYISHVICAQGSNGMILMGTNGRVNHVMLLYFFFGGEGGWTWINKMYESRDEHYVTCSNRLSTCFSCLKAKQAEPLKYITFLEH
jgi:hypothetical protein